MKENTTRRKKAIRGIEEVHGRHWLVERLFWILSQGKQGFDAMMKDLGMMMAETIMYIDREDVAGPDYVPFSPDVRKWASQSGGDRRDIHRLKIPALLRKTLHSTNPIESMFSTIRDAEGNIKRYRDSKMMQRWLAAVLLYSEKGFKRIKGYASIPDVIRNIDATEENTMQIKKAA